ncbi:MAG TPA: methylmalonyl-CoA mutase family protein [Caulobacteraceae bacterium]|jgi:methylmalonyl-CoA mutase
MQRPASPEVAPLSETLLATDFQPAAHAEWLALVEKTLKGVALESLDTTGPDGLIIHPLYERDDAPRRFTPPQRSQGQPWDIRTRIRYPSKSSARDAALDELAGGAASVILAVRQKGADGIDIRSADDMAAVLEGILFDVAPLALDAGLLGPSAAEWLSAAVKDSPSAPLALHLDPIGAFARSGSSDGPIESHLGSAARIATTLNATHPRASLFLASGAVVHEAGGGPAQELAFVLATALAYLKAAVSAGLDGETAAARIVLGLSVDVDPLISISKLRAARMVWMRFAEACDLPPSVSVEARSSQRMLARTEPWTNMIRLTAACLAAAVGGADAIVLSAFTDAVGLPTPFARRMARNTQLVLMEEARLGVVSDPVGGSGAFEALSTHIARSAWSRFNAIEASGGILAALRDGLIADDVQDGVSALKEAIASGAAKIVGITDFRAEVVHPATVEAPQAAAGSPPDAKLPGPDSHCPPLTPVSLEDLAS